MEFVVVTFPSLRPVRVDGARLGQTGQLLRLQRGNHIFDLGNPPDYAPPSVQTPVVNTSQATPMLIAFQPMAFAPGAVVPLAPPPPPPPAPPPAARRAVRTAAKKKGAAKRKKGAARKPKKPAKGGRKRATRKRDRRKTR